MCERSRLRDRIHSITGTDTARELKRFRRDINRRDAIVARGVAFSIVTLNGRRFVEAEDALPLLHRWLDERGVPPCFDGVPRRESASHSTLPTARDH